MWDILFFFIFTAVFLTQWDFQTEFVIPSKNIPHLFFFLIVDASSI